MSQIITAADFQSYMQDKATDTAMVARVTAAVNQWIETRTKRCFGETRQLVDELYNWNSVVWLRHQDIVTIDSVKLGWPGQTESSINPTAYYLNPLGRVTFYMYANPNMSRLYNDYLHISYTYGVTEVPDDLKLAALGIATGFYNWAVNGGKDVVAAEVGSYRLQYAGSVRSAGASGPDPANNTTDANWGVVDSYRMRRA